MAQPRNTKRLSEVEYCLDCYFNTYFIPVMNHEKSVLQAAQAKEVADYSNSFAGIMRTLAQSSSSAGIPGPDDTMQYLRLTGKECSKTAEDYVGMCKDSILGNKDFVADLQRLAGEWRNAVVAEVGRKRYDELSSKLGTDLALAYVDHRIEQMMVDRMVRDQMPKGSFDYIIRKGASGSLFGLSQELMKSPLQREIEERGEAIYKPSKTEKGAAKGVSFASDVVALGGVYSWGALVRLAGAEVVFSGLESVLDKKQQKKGLTVDQCVSTGLFGNGSTLSDIRKDSWRIKTYESGYIQSVNGTLSKKMPILKEKPAWETDWSLGNLQNPFQNQGKGFIPLKFDAMSFTNPQAVDRGKNFSAVPSVIAPGHEQEYLDWKAKNDWEQAQKKQQPPQAAEENTEVREQETPDGNNAPDGFVINKETKYPEKAFEVLQKISYKMSLKSYQASLDMPVWDVKDQVDESKIDPLFKTIAEDAQNATGYIAWWDTFFEGSAAQDYLYALIDLSMGDISAEEFCEKMDTLN